MYYNDTVWTYPKAFIALHAMGSGGGNDRSGGFHAHPTLTNAIHRIWATTNVIPQSIYMSAKGTWRT